MNDSRASSASVIAWAAWATVVAVIGHAWLALLLDYRDVAFLLGCTAGVLAPAAATAHVRSFSIRILRVVRTLHQLDDAGRRLDAADRAYGDVRQIR